MNIKLKLLVGILGWIVCGTFMLFFGVEDTLDSRFYYSSPEAIEYLTSLSSKQKVFYLYTEFFDLGYLISYSLIFHTLYVKYLNKFSKWSLVPGGLDLIETSCLIAYLLGFSFHQFGLLGIVSSVKWASAGILLIILVGFRVQKIFGLNIKL